jgi:nucleotide-binding universal stress UspA family protein
MEALGKILVPIDFEAPSEQALQVAADLARRFASSLTLAHVYDARGYALLSGYVAYTRDELHELTANLARRLGALKAELESLGVSSVRTELVEGLPAPTILELAHTGGFDLIVMATHGKASPWQRLIGLVAEDVLSEAPCPVVMVNEQRASAEDRPKHVWAPGEQRHAH